MSNNLLVELFVEELPPKALKKLGDAFAGAIFESLKAQELTALLADIITNTTQTKTPTRQEITQANTRLQNQIDEIRTELSRLKQTKPTNQR